MVDIFCHGAEMHVVVRDRPHTTKILRAWKHSRPNDETKSIETIAAIDVPVNEMDDFILEIYAPIIVREVLFGLRDHVAWARTSRVDDLTQWPIYQPSLFGYEADIQQLMVQMKRDMVDGNPQDDFRMNLPLCYMTHFTMKITPRTLLKVMGTLTKEIALAPDTLIRNMWRDLKNLFKSAIAGGPWQAIGEVDGFGSVPLVNRAGIDPVDQPSGFLIGGMVAARLGAVPLALRAQLVRHRPVSIRDDLVQYLTAKGITRSIRNTLNVEVAMTQEMATSLVIKRNCWISQDDLWAPVLKALNSAIGGGHKVAGPILPCNGRNDCPIERDNVLRFEGKDPAPPCPIWMKMKGQHYTSPQIDPAYAFSKRRQNPGWWQNRIVDSEV